MPQNAVGLLSSKATPTLARASPISAKPGLRSPTLKFSTVCNVFRLQIVMVSTGAQVGERETTIALSDEVGSAV